MADNRGGSFILAYSNEASKIVVEMADIYTQAVSLAFEGIMVTITTLLILTYVIFLRMDAPMRRARMYIMSDKLQRILLAFMVAFLSLTVTFLGNFAGLGVPAIVSTFIVFLFFGLIGYAFLELFFVARPTSRWNLKRKGRARGVSMETGAPK